MMTLLKNRLLIIMFFLAGFACAQVSVFGMQAQDVFSQNNPSTFRHESRMGIAYWFRLKKVRIEFYPSLLLGSLSNSSGFEVGGASLAINLYPFDFYNDCKCPTFNKTGEWWKKGFFWQLEPAYNNTNGMEFYSASFRAGLDLGITKNLTLSPAIGYQLNHFPNSISQTEYMATGALRLQYSWSEN